MILNLKLFETGLKTSDIEKIQSIFNSYSEVQKVILYGSRAKGNFKAFSDVDLTLVGAELSLTIQQKIENEIDDLLLPYKFDISIFEKIQNIEMVDHIKRVGKIFFER